MQKYNANGKTELKFRAYKYSLLVINLLSKLSHDQINKIIIDQLLRAATSIGANIIEAQSASSKKDFARYYEIALKSSNETKYWLCLLRDTPNNLDKKQVNNALNEVVEISKIIAASIITLKGKRFF